MNRWIPGIACFLLVGICACRTKTEPVAEPVADRSTRAPAIEVLHADSPEETRALNEAFKGVSTDGHPETGLYSIRATGVSTSPILQAVTTFLSTLSQQQRDSCMFPIADKEWRRWTNIDIGEYKRKGIGLHTLSDPQKEMAFDILRSSLSPQGVQKARDIMKMEGYLARLTGHFDILGPEFYWFTFMGTPSESEPWGWQLDGHHLVINYFILGDQIVMTPTFMGSEPNYIPDGENAGTRTFEAEQRLGLALYQSLEGSVKAQATLLDRKEYDYNQTEAFHDNAVVPYAGVRVSEFSEEQRARLRQLIAEFIGNLREGHAEVKMEEIWDHIENTYFSWVGDPAGEGPFYYRIQSPVVIIEFDHHRPVFLEGDLPSKKHVHTVVRTPNGNDYGKDLLRQHLEAHPH